MVNKDIVSAQFGMAPFIMKVNTGRITNQRQAQVESHYAMELDLIDIDLQGRLKIRPRGWEVLLRQPARRVR
jgi:hypothetical protein